MKIKRMPLLLAGIVLTGMIGAWICNSNKMSVEAKVKNNLTKIFEADRNVIVSSNPYSYTNNEYYKDIVDMGMDAVEVLLKDECVDKTSLDGYVAAIAVSEITGVDIQSISGKDWETAEEFWNEWDKVLEEMPDKFEKILNEEDAEEKLEKYGVFSDALIRDVLEDKDGKVEFANEEINYDGNVKSELSEKSAFSADELDKAEEIVKQYN